jgi:uncharacterized membrane protein
LTSDPNRSRPLPALLLCALGFAVSGVLEWVHISSYIFASADSFCTAGAFDCKSVALSRMSILFGVPLPIWGMLGFGTMFAAAWRRSRLLVPLAVFSAIASIALLVEELVHVGTVCLLCEAVHVVAIALAFFAWRGRRALHPATPRDAAQLLLPPLGLAIAVRTFIPPYWAFVLWLEGPPLPTGHDDDGAPWIGDESPELVVHEYVDYGCPHCALASNRMRMKLLRTDGLRVVRHFQPRMKCRAGAQHACLTLRAALCGDEQGKFWEIDSWLFAHAPGSRDLDVLQAVEDLGLDRAQFEACLVADHTYVEAERHASAARKRKIIETPGYVVDDEKLDPKAVYELIDDRL